MTLFQKTWYLLTVKQKRTTLWLLVLMIISMFFEMLGIGFIMPVMTLLTQEHVVENYPFLQPLLHILGNPKHDVLIVMGMLTLVVIYATKVCFLAFLVFVKSKFFYGVQASLSQRLFSGYLRQPYTFHLQRNSAQLIRNIMTETNIFTFNTIISTMTFTTECFVLVGVTSLLLYVEPMGAILVSLSLGGAGYVFHTFTKKHLLRWGQARQLHEGLRIQHIQQGLSSFKDVKLLGREDDFLNQYQVHNQGYASAGRWQNFMQSLPILWLELLGITALAILLVTMMVQGKPVASFMATMGVFVASAFRILPATNRLLSAMQNLRYSLPSTDLLYSEMVKVEEHHHHNISQSNIIFSNTIQLHDVHYTYPESHKAVIEKVNLTIHKGTSVAFIGDSGAGKSTLIDLILGLLVSTKGYITVDGVNIQSNIRAWQDQIGYVPQHIYLSDDTIYRNIAFGIPIDQINESYVLQAIKNSQLDDFIESLPAGVNTLVGERGVRLSGGQRQRIGIARALYHNPHVLILDEATSALDLQTEESVMQSVYALQGARTLIIISHRLSTVRYCDRVISFNHGQMLEGKIAGNESLSFDSLENREQLLCDAHVEI